MTTSINAAKFIFVGDEATQGPDGIVRLNQKYRVEMADKTYSAADALFALSASGTVPSVFSPQGTGGAVFFSTWNVPNPAATNSSVASTLFAGPNPAFKALEKTAKRVDADSLIFDITVKFAGLSPELQCPTLIDPTPGGSANTIFVFNTKISSTSQQSNEEIFTDYCPAGVTPPYRSSPGPQQTLILTGEPLNPPLTEDFYDELLNISFSRNTAAPRNVPGNTYSQHNYYDVVELAKGYSNSNTVTLTINGVVRTFAANTFKIYDGQASYDNLTGVVNVALVALVRNSGWITYVQSQSTQVLRTAGDFTSIDNGTSGKGGFTTSPRFHNSSGTDFVHSYGALPPPMAFYPCPQADLSELLFGVTSM